MKTHPPFLRRLLYWFINHVYFARITVLNRSRVPRNGPVLFLGLHRNGAIDGFVYHQALDGPTFMISTQLRKSWLARLFFTGIAVTRTKDEGERAGNDRALTECLKLLRRGGALCVFPEGTSSLGPHHLPFKSGALWLILEYLEKPGPALHVIPVGIHYECPWAFRAKVEVVLGEPLDLGLLPALPRAGSQAPANEPVHMLAGGAPAGILRKVSGSPDGLRSNSLQLSRLKALKRAAQTGLEKVGINVASEEYQSQIQRLAYISTLGTPRSYFASLKALEKLIPESILKEADVLEPELQGARLLRHQGVPLVPMGPLLLYLVAFAILAPVVMAAVLLNALPMAAGFLAAKKLPDDVNVISLWRVLVGIPSFLIWIIITGGVCLSLGKPLWLLLYAAITWSGLQLYYRVKKLAVALHNGLRHPNLKPAMLRFRETVIGILPPDPFA